MTRLRDFIDKRAAEIKAAGEPLIQRRESLRAEMAELDSKIEALNAEWCDLQKATDAIGREEGQRRGQPRWSPVEAPTIKDAIILVLGDHPKGINAADLYAAVNERFFDGKLDRTSFSPQMSRLKNKDRKVIQKGELYFRKHEGPAFAEPS